MSFAALSGCRTPFTLALSQLPSRAAGRELRFALLALAMLPVAPAMAAGTLYIGGSPPATVGVSDVYYFAPWKAGSLASGATFQVRKLPAWCTFSSSNGAIRCPARADDVGTYTGVDIGVVNGSSSAWMPAWSITVTSGTGSSTTTGTTTSPPKISGNPTTSVAVGTAYSFIPTASDPNGLKVSFSINTKPSWASFDATTGKLSGTPAAANVGTLSNLIITATDGKASASLPAFSLTVTQIAAGSATVSWAPPIANTDGSTLTNLAGYLIKYGTNKAALSQTIQVANPGLTRYVIANLSPGTYYFGTQAYTATGTQSALSALASKTIK